MHIISRTAVKTSTRPTNVPACGPRASSYVRHACRCQEQGQQPESSDIGGSVVDTAERAVLDAASPRMPLRALRLQLRYARSQLEGRRADSAARFIDVVRTAVSDLAKEERGVLDVLISVPKALAEEFQLQVEAERRRGAVADAVGEGCQETEDAGNDTDDDDVVLVTPNAQSS